MASYEDFIGLGNYTDSDPTSPNYQGLILGWANRDDDALPVGIRRDVLRWAADQCYSLLKVPPLELTRTFTITESDFAEDPAAFNGRELIMPVPNDLIQVVYIRSNRNSCVFEEKLDNRTFFQREAEKKSSAWWTRVGNNFHLQTIGYGLRVGDEITIHYYRRLPAMDARYLPSAANFNAQTSVGQLMVQQPTPAIDPIISGDTEAAAIARFLAIPGNGVLYFEEFYPITIENFNMGDRIVPVAAGTAGIDGSLWFHDEVVDWPVNIDNWNMQGRENNDRISWAPEGSPFTGSLWFDPNEETDDLQVPSGNNQVFTNEVVLGGTSGITRVARVRQGTETELNLGTDYILELRDDGRVNVIFSGTVSTADIYLVSYNARPLNPLFQTAFADNSTGMRTEFNFLGHLNLAEVVPGIRVSDTSSIYFNQQVFFTGDREFTSTPVPGDNTAFTDSTGMHSAPFYYRGNEIAHWLRDENERIVLFGALAEAFAYLQEDTMQQKYSQMFVDQINLINREETMRKALGGNVQTTFNGRGLI